MKLPPLSGSPEREELLALYELHIEEYRFQVNLNAQRAQYFLVLSVGILGAGIGFLRLEGPRVLLAGIFAAGAAIALLGFLVALTGHNYYRAIRQGIQRLENALGLQPLVLGTTPGMRRQGRERRSLRWLPERLRRWPPRTVDATLAVFLAVSLLDVVGLVYVAWAGWVTPGGLLPCC